MNFSNKKLRPSLVDQTLLNQYMKIKNPDPIKIIHLPAKEPSELQKIILYCAKFNLKREGLIQLLRF